MNLDIFLKQLGSNNRRIYENKGLGQDILSNDVFLLTYNTNYIETAVKRLIDDEAYDDEKEAKDYISDYISGSGSWVVDIEGDATLFNSWSKAIKHYCSEWEELEDEPVESSIKTALARVPQSKVLSTIKKAVSTPEALAKKLGI